MVFFRNLVYTCVYKGAIVKNRPKILAVVWHKYITFFDRYWHEICLNMANMIQF